MEQIRQLMALMDRPAFCVEDDRITAVNPHAQSLQLCVGSPIADLLSSGMETYRSFQSGFLCLELTLCGGRCPATVTAIGSRRLFTLEPEQTGGEMRMLSLAAQQLREPLCDVMSLVEELDPDGDPDRLAGINRGLYRLLRIVGNMTPHPAPRPEMMDVNALLQEVWDKAQPACESRGVRFRFVPSPAPVYSCVDGDLLTRAIHNLLSNSLKFSPGSELRLQLTLRRPFYRITYWDSGAALPDDLRDPFTRYLREPGLEDPRSGLGMGMHLVRSAALAHGGTALMHTPKEGGLLVTLAMPVHQDVSTVRSTRLHLSYSGERDPLLIELADVLPPDFYKV